MTARVTFGATNFTATNDGIGRVSRLCALAMIEGGYEPDLISFLDKPPASLAGRPVKAMNGGKIRFAARCLASALPAGRPVLYATAGLARAGRALPFLSAPYGVWIHGVEVWGEPAPRGDYMAAIKGSRLIIANSAFTLDRAQEKLGPLPQGRLCWLATEQDEAAGPVARDGPPTVLILGRISLDEGYKGHDELVDAWPRVIHAAPDARLLIAGAGSGLDALRARVAASPAVASIDILGFVPEAEMDALWNRASVFAMPSRGEGFGLVYIEAMRRSVPVIASVHDAGQEVNVDGETGFNVSLDRKNELPDRLIELLTNADQRRRMGENGLARWREHFRFSRFKDRFLAILDPFVSGR